MAQRPIFIPNYQQSPFFKEINIEFEWYPGFSTTQAQKSVKSLHEAAKKIKGISPILEISSKSPEQLGIQLSAFNLSLNVKGKTLSVECAYQGSKVFKGGGPYHDLYFKSSREAKKDPRLKNSGEFKGYNFFGQDFPSKPVTVFYDWLYLKALYQNLELANELINYKGFTDIAFNPSKSLNCQARAAALFLSLNYQENIERVLEDKDYYFSLVSSRQEVSINRNYSSSSNERKELNLSQLDLPLTGGIMPENTKHESNNIAFQVKSDREVSQPLYKQELQYSSENSSIYEVVLPLIIKKLRKSNKPEDYRELAKSLEVEEKQMKIWLEKAAKEEKVIKKKEKPATYAVI